MSSYKALYRQYRPKNLNEVIGQEHVVTTLKNIILNKQISHAYLFSGTRGTGKTSTALAFAKTLNCSNLKENCTPCQECKQCESTKNSLDIIEMDAASNNGVAEIRNLVDNVKYAPSISQYKVYIIDEVHMLSRGAFNALLKTLEEPPKYVIFILATTEAHKIPSTILSRTQRFNFHKVENKVIAKHLQEIMQKENFAFDDESLDLIVKLANGSVRDALSILDQVAAYSNGKIYFESISQVFGITSLDNQISLLNWIFQNQTKEALAKITNWINNGIDINRLVSSFVTILKDYIVFTQTKELSLLEIMNKQDLENLKISKEFAYKALDIFVELISSLRMSALPKQIFEIAILKVLDLNKKKTQSKDESPIKQEDISNTQEETFFEEKKEEKFIQKESQENATNEEGNLDNFSNMGEKEQLKPEDLFVTVNEDLPDFASKETAQNAQNEKNNIEKQNINPNLEQQQQEEENTLENKDFKMQNREKTLENESILDSHSNNNKNKGDEINILDVFEIEKDDIANDNNNSHLENEIKKYKPLTLNEVINVLLQSNKDFLIKAKEKLGLIDQYSHNIEYGNFVTILKKIKIISSGDGFVLVSAEKDTIIHTLEEIVNDSNFIKFTNELFESPQKFFPISKQMFLQAKEKWTSLKENNNLPEIIKIEKLDPLPKEQDETEEFATSIFGDAFEK